MTTIYMNDRGKWFYIVHDGVIYGNTNPTISGAVKSGFNGEYSIEEFDKVMKRQGFIHYYEKTTMADLVKSDFVKATGVVIALSALFVFIMSL